MPITHAKRLIVGGAALAALALTLAACSSSPTPASTPSASSSSSAQSAALTKLIAAAKAEGSVNWYSAIPIASSEYAAQQFQNEYGIHVNLLSLSGGPLVQRFASEAQAGDFNADVLVSTDLDPQATSTFIPNGWLTTIRKAGIPEIDSKTFPSAYIGTNTATISYIPWVIAYNTNLVSKQDAPKTFADLANPKWKGKILTSDPSASVAYVQFWDRIQKVYGTKTLKGIGANDPKFEASAAAAAQDLAAGEGEVNAPTSVPAIQAVISAGAPVAYIAAPHTTGAQMEIGMIPSNKAPHPNAARLFANWLLSPAGDKAVAQVGHDVWVLDPTLSTKDVTSLTAAEDAANRQTAIFANLGLK